MAVNVLKIYDVHKYAQDMFELYDELKQLLDDRFNGQANFLPEDRIVFYIHDVDYFIDDSFPGFLLYNLQLILHKLDISNFFCMVVSNMPGYDKYTSRVRDIVCPDDVPLRCVTMFSTQIQQIKYSGKPFPADQDTNLDHIEHAFIVLSRLKRFHRAFFMAKLFEQGLENYGLVSYHNIDYANDTPMTKAPRSPDLQPLHRPDDLFFLTTHPFSYTNNHSYLRDAHNRRLVVDFQQRINTYKNFEESADIANKLNSMGFQNSLIQRALLYVILETVTEYPTPVVTEKTYKSMIEKRPFVVFGSPGIIKLLQDQGFKTFGAWWDESYSDDPNCESRLDKIIKIIADISKLNTSQLRDLCMDMQSVLDHNYRHFVDTWPKQELLEYDRVLRQTHWPMIDRNSTNRML